jgi:hypothetical protein
MADEYRHLPEQDYTKDEIISTFDFIYFVQDYTQFLTAYINDKYKNYPDELNKYTRFLEFCNGINTDHGDDGSFEEKRAYLLPFMTWVTEIAPDMNKFYRDNYEQQELSQGGKRNKIKKPKTKNNKRKSRKNKRQSRKYKRKSRKTK